MTLSAVDLLIAARQGGPALRAADMRPADAAAAYALQDALLERIGPIGGWKVGAKTPTAEPSCAPMPASGILPTGTSLQLVPSSLRGIEVEIAFRVRRDISGSPQEIDALTMDDMFDAVFPAIEVVETRLADFIDADPFAKLADLSSHGALVVGPAASVRPGDVQLPQLRAILTFDGQSVADTIGGNPAVDLLRLSHWLATHCVQRGSPLRKGQIVTTGSCTGMLFAQSQQKVEGEIVSIGKVELRNSR